MNALPLSLLVSAFRSFTLPREAWTHAAHLRVGIWHVHQLGADAALAELRSGIRRLNEFHGTPNSPTSGYHETITVAYVRLIEMSMDSFGPDVSLERRAEILLEGPLADRSALLRFWSRDALMSPRARAEWLAPDLAPLALLPR